MIRQEAYVKCSEMFGTPVGMARGIEMWDAHTFKLTDDMRVNEIIANSIEDGTYQKVRREVIRLEKIGRRNIKELTIYKKAIKGDSRSTTKSAEIFQ